MTLALLETPVQYDDPQEVKGPSVGEIVTRLGIRKSEHGVTQEISRIISQTYGGNLAIPLTEADKREPLSTANFLVQGIDQHAFRISRTRAEITVPSTDPGKPRADDLARLKRRVFYGMWSVNDMLSIDEKRARWLVAYTKAPVLLRPDMEKRSKTCGGVKWEPRTPLETYSSIPLDSLDIEPEDCIFTYMRTFKWVTDRYPDAARQINVSRMDTEKVKPEDLVDIIEYVDDEVRVLIAAGRGRPNGVVHEAEYGVNGAVIYNIGMNSPNHWAVELIRITNRAGVCPVVIPTRISLDEAKGQFDDALGIFQLLAKMQAMNVNAIAKGIWPDTWMIHAPGKTGRIVKMADGLLGKIGEVADGDLKAFTEQPNPQVMNMLNYLERAIRQNGAMPAEFGGECADEETEILTASGWKRHDQVAVGDEVLTLNHDTGLSEWQPIQRMNRFVAQERDMVEMEGPRFSALTTTNHRWPVINWAGERVWKTSPNVGGHDQIPIAAINADLPVDAKWSDALVEVVGWYWTEGSFTPSKGQISQSIKNPEKVARIRAALTTLWGEPTERMRDVSGCGQGGVGHDGVPRWSEAAPSRQNGVIKWTLSAHAVRALTEFAPGKEKVPTFDFLRSLTQAQLELFIRVSMLADNAGSDRLGQKNRAGADAFAFACILAGYGVSQRVRTTTEGRDGWRTGEYVAHIVRIRKRLFSKPKEAAQRGVATFRIVKHTGVVWCPTTGNQSWMARRNGAVYFTGNSPTNVRTDKRGLTVDGAQVDYYIAAHQTALERSKKAEFERAMAIDLAYFGGPKKKSIFSMWPGVKGRMDYRPRDLWRDDDTVMVSYNYVGLDANGMTVRQGQLLGMGAMSVQTIMEQSPDVIEDAEMERGRVNADQVDKVIWAQMQQPGAITLPDAATLKQLVRGGMEIEDALIKVQAAAQARQASSGAPGTPEGPVQPGSPEAQPGLAPPGAGQEQPTISPLAPSLNNYRGVLQELAKFKSAGAPQAGTL